MFSLNPEIEAALLMYNEIGFDTLPLPQDSKTPNISGWQYKNSFVMWQTANTRSNIAIRCGGESQISVLDCDEEDQPGTYHNTIGLLSGLGLELGAYPIVQTASKINKHIYFSIKEDLPGSYCYLLPEFGKGEFRYGPGAIVVAHPSVIRDNKYTVLNGSFERIPTISIDDLSDVAVHRSVLSIGNKKRPHIPRNAWQLLKGKRTQYYPSRSEAEQAAIVSLINTGNDYNRIQTLFRNYPVAGKFAELNRSNPNRAEDYLRRSYHNAIIWVQSNESPARYKASALRSWALDHPWPGRTGSSDRRIYLAHLGIAHTAGKLTYQASTRTLGELGGVSHRTAGRATRRLCETGLISLEKKSVRDLAPVYNLILPQNVDALPHDKEVREWVSIYSHDVFRCGGLSHSAAEIYQSLLKHPGTIEDLVRRTGRTAPTVSNWLERMSRLIDLETGEIIKLVRNKGENWYALEVDLDRVAEILGTKGTGKRQKQQHNRERLLHRRSLNFISTLPKE